MNAATCTINLGITRQIIDGFGGCSYGCNRLSAAACDTLFLNNSNSQLGFTLHRVRIDPTEGSYGRNTERDNAANAHARGALVLGTPWTPPAYMKSGGSEVGGSLLPQYYAAYATYLGAACTDLGLDFISIQNEPDVHVTYESCDWTAEQLHIFCRDNALPQNIIKPVVMPETTGFKAAYCDPTLNDPLSVGNITFVAGHAYGSLLKLQNALDHGKRLWMTEHYYSGATIGTCINIAKEISNCMNLEMSAYIWWWVFPWNNDEGRILEADGSARKNGYVIGQFAKWVRPGYLRVDATYTPTSKVYVTAYKGGGNKVIVAVNSGNSAVSQAFSFSGGTVTSLNRHRTSSTENIADLGPITVSNNSFTTSLPAQSVTTFSTN
ncbi:MAG: hypothetical protein Q7S40_33920 [Opitutaceae bacterium]|nr:hypothetical protein [Opitutaceae bacterium]